MSGKSEKKELPAVEAPDTEKSSRHAIKLFDVNKEKLKTTKVEQSDPKSITPFRRVHYTYEYEDGERDLLEVRHPDYMECYISRREDKKKNKDDQEYLAVSYSVTAYFDVDKDKQKLAALQVLNDCFVLACGTVKAELAFGAMNYTKKRFVEGGEEKGCTELWYSMIQSVQDKPKRLKVKFKCPGGRKPHLKRFLSPKEREALAAEKGIKPDSPAFEKIPKTKELDADHYLGGKCLHLRSLRSQHPKTHFGEKAWPQSHFYSAVVMDITKKGVPEDLDDDEYEGAAESTDLDALAEKMARIEAMPIDFNAGRKKPAAAGEKGEKNKGGGTNEIKVGEAKADESEKVQEALQKLKERKLADKKAKEAAAAKLEPKDEDEEEVEKPVAKKEKKSKKKSPKKGSDDEEEQ
jgi:hypothetical protein